MSLYGMMFGQNTAELTVAVALLEAEQPGVVAALRLRDAWFEKSPEGEPLLVIYTRNGGGNRDCYCEDYADDPGYGQGTCTGCRGDAATRHPSYLRDADDDFDCTYRTYWFRLPPGHAGELRDLILERCVDEPVDTDQRWADMIASLSAGRQP